MITLSDEEAAELLDIIEGGVGCEIYECATSPGEVEELKGYIEQARTLLTPSESST